MRPITFLFTLLISLSLQAQSARIEWKETFGGKAEDVILDVIQSTNGDIIAVGSTESNTKGGKDGLLIISDFKTGKAIHKRNIGGKQDDEILGVVQKKDGTLMLAGYTKSKGKGNEDGWLIHADIKGNILWEKTFGASQNDQFTAITTDARDLVIVAGFLSDQKQGDVWMLIFDDENTVWESEFGNGELDKVQAIATTRENDFVFTGTTKKSKRRKAGDAWLVKTDKKGNEKFRKYYGGDDWDEALDVINTVDNGFAIAGLTRSKGNGDLDMWLIKADIDGHKEWDKTYGGSDADFANSIIQTYDYGFALFGASKSHTSGARQFKMSLVQTNERGLEINQRYYGGNKEDEGKSIFQLYDGSLLMAGLTSSEGAGADDAWIQRTAISKFRSNEGTKSQNNQWFDFTDVKLVTNSETGELSAGENAYLTFDVFNKTQTNLIGVQAEVKAKVQVSGLSYWENIYVGHLAPGRSKTITVPITTNDQLQSGSSEFDISLKQNQNVLQSTVATIGSKSFLPATLAFAGHQFITNTNRNASASYRTTLKVNIKNVGEESAESIQVKFIPKNGVKAISKTKFSVDFLRPGAAHMAFFDFLVNNTEDYQNGEIPVECIVIESSRQKEITQTFEFKIDQPQLNNTAPISARSNTEMVWISPNPDEFDNTSFASDKEFIDIKIKAVSDQPLKAKDFTVFLNNTSQDGSKFDEEDLSKPRRSGARYTHTYTNRILLNKGENIVEVEVTNELGETRTIPIKVNFAPQRANLHILAIGPTHKDLQYTGKDARDFAAAFTNQDNRLFEKIFVRTLSNENETDQTSVMRAMKDLQIKYESDVEDKISDNDLLMIFISSHGKKDGKSFKILTSGYSPLYAEFSTIDYEKNIIQYLSNINCKKMVLIDACNSGSAYAMLGSKAGVDDGMSKALHTIITTNPGVSTITSCQKYELSYEDEAWQNGAFTEAILEAFENKVFTDGQGKKHTPDADRDYVITIGELSSYLKARVPHLVNSTKPDAPTGQIPHITANQLGMEFPIYSLDKN